MLSLFCVLLFNAPTLEAKGVYLTGDEFLQSSFLGSTVTDKLIVKTLWLNQQQKQQAAKILGHQFNGFRVRYWQTEAKSAWILEEIGKELPITIGVVVANNKVQQVKILTYRESRGGEVRYPIFLQQYVGGMLDDNYRLSHNIDGITGATLSVRAVTNTSRLALYFHQLTLTQ